MNSPGEEDPQVKWKPVSTAKKTDLVRNGPAEKKSFQFELVNGQNAHSYLPLKT